MTSPLVRAWLAARIVDWADHAYAIGRGILFGLGLTDREWDPAEVRYCALCKGPARDLLDVPGPAIGTEITSRAGAQPGAVTAAGLGSAPPPALHLMLPCGTCGAHANAPCVTRYGEQTGPHKKRRTAAADAVLGGES